MTPSSAALGTQCRISFNPSPVAPLTSSPNHNVPGATLVLTRFLMSIRLMGTARCQPYGTIIPSQSHRRCASPRRSQRQCESRVRYGLQTNAVRTLILPTPLFFFLLSIRLSLRFSAVVCRHIFAFFKHSDCRVARSDTYAHRVVPAWVSYLNMSILIGTLAVALFNASKDPIASNFAYVYALISIGILVGIRSVRIRSVNPSLFEIPYPSFFCFFFCAKLFR